MVLRAALVSLLCLATSHGSAGAPSATGDPEAVDVYNRMTGALGKAKSLELSCKAHFKAEGFEAKVVASLLTKEGNKMRLDVDITGVKDRNPYSHSTCMVSNGAFLRIRDNQGPWAEYATTKNWNEMVLRNITRGGFPTGLELESIKSKEDNRKGDIAVAFFPIPEPVEFVLWKKEEINRREVIPVEFKVKCGAAFFKENAAILWVDANNYLPVKRLNVIQSDRTLTVTENYETVSLNPPLEDSRFELPKD